MRLSSFALCLATLLYSATAGAERHAGAPLDAAHAQLGTLNANERSLLSAYLDRGPVVLTEYRPKQSELPAIIYAARVRAPASVVAQVIGQPKHYPKFMDALESIDVKSSHGNSLSYEWSWQVSLFSFHGHNVMTSFPAQPGSPRGYRFDIRAMGGDLGVGRMSWRVYPDGPNQALVVFSSRIDMREANYITQTLSAGGNSINRTINLTLATVLLLETQAEAERRAGSTSATGGGRSEPFGRPDVDTRALAGLLRRGDLVMLQMAGNQLSQVTALGRMGARTAEVRQLMNDPEQFGRSMVHGSQTKVIGRDASSTLFEWRIPLPLIGVGGTMRLKPSPTVIAVDGVSGSLSEGRWRFDTFRMPGGDTGLIGWAEFDPADTVKLLKRLIAGNENFSHGLTASTQLMLVRSLRGRVRQLSRR